MTFSDLPARCFAPAPRPGEASISDGERSDGAVAIAWLDILPRNGAADVACAVQIEPLRELFRHRHGRHRRRPARLGRGHRPRPGFWVILRSRPPRFLEPRGEAEALRNRAPAHCAQHNLHGFSKLLITDFMEPKLVARIGKDVFVVGGWTAPLPAALRQGQDHSSTFSQPGSTFLSIGLGGLFVGFGLQSRA